MLGYLTNINGDRYPVILKSDIRFFLMISLKDITIYLIKKKTRIGGKQIDG
jgi:hypothetical protein